MAWRLRPCRRRTSLRTAAAMAAGRRGRDRPPRGATCRLEQKVGSGKSTDGERLEALSAQVERRMKGVKAGMEALHGRLQAVEVAMAKLPEHLKSFKSKAKEQAKLGRAHTERCRSRACDAWREQAATECNRRVAELQKLAAALASGSDEALELAAAAGDVEAQAEEDGVRRRSLRWEREKGPLRERRNH